MLARLAVEGGSKILGPCSSTACEDANTHAYRR
jgi:hypothetical protein